MACEGKSKWCSGSQKHVMVVLVAAVLLLSAQAVFALPLQNVCLIPGRSVKLYTHERIFFTTSAETVRIKARSGCINETNVFRLSELTVSDAVSETRENSSQWYELNFINCERYLVRIGSQTVRLKKGKIHPLCSMKPVTFSVDAKTELGKICSKNASPREEKRESKKMCKELSDEESLIHNKARDYLLNLDDVEDTSIFNWSDWSDIPSVPILKNTELDANERFFDSSNINKYEDLLYDTLPTKPSYKLDDSLFGSDKTYTYRRESEENAIPIFIGIVAFTVSMCLRFCLCRGKSVVQRVTTVTLISSRPVAPPEVPQEQQDPPPAYTDVVNEAQPPETPAIEACEEPPPPAYAEVANEVLPPTYSEVETQSVSTSEEAPFADQEVVDHTSQSPPAPEETSENKDSASPRRKISKSRSQQKQFAFKLLEEDD